MLRVAKTENGIVQGLPAADPRITSFKGYPLRGASHWGKQMARTAACGKLGWSAQSI